MNQAYFTFCCSGTGKSLSGAGGDRPRAAVKGTSEQKLTVYKKICGFPQYSDMNKFVSQQETGFCSEHPFAKLVYSTDGSASSPQYILAHSVYALPDKETHREGNYFSHLIYPVPNSWSVRTALEMWGSPFWVTQDSDDILPELPPVDEYSIEPGIINEKSFVKFLRLSPERQKKFLFLLKTLLTLKPNDKIVLTGVPEDAAFCLWGATRCLPSSMWNKLTFSTHEKPGVSFSFDVVNYPLSSTLDTQEEYVFNELRRRSNVRFYSNNPLQTSSSEPNLSFAEDILEICVNDQFETLDEFYRTIPLAYKNSGLALQLFWIFKNHHEQISYDDVKIAIEIPKLKNAAIKALMDASRCTLDQQLVYYHNLDACLQDVLLNRMISENSIEQIRSNLQYSELLISALKMPEEPGSPEKKRSFFQRLFGSSK